MNTSNKKNKSDGYQIKGPTKGRSRETVIKEVKRGLHIGTHIVQVKDREYVRSSSTGRFDELPPLSYDSKGEPEGYIIKFDEYEDLHDRLAALEAYRRIKSSGGIPHEIVKLELSGLSPLAAWRKHRGMTQQALAKAADITQPYVAAIEGGHKEGKASTLRQLAETLGTSIENLID